MKTTVLHDILRRILSETKLVRMVSDPASCHLDAFHEDFAEVARQLYAAITRHVKHFDEEYATVAARTVSDETSNDAGLGRLLCDLVFKLLNAKNGLDVLERQLRPVCFGLPFVVRFHKLNCFRTTYRANLALKIAHP